MCIVQELISIQQSDNRPETHVGEEEGADPYPAAERHCSGAALSSPSTVTEFRPEPVRNAAAR